MSSRPKWLDRTETTRSRSKHQESKIAKELKGRTTINSGATFGENDVVTDYCDIEAKVTAKDSFRVTNDDWIKLVSKCKPGKIPIAQIDLQNGKRRVAVLLWDDLLYLINSANGKRKGK